MGPAEVVNPWNSGIRALWDPLCMKLSLFFVAFNRFVRICWARIRLHEALWIMGRPSKMIYLFTPIPFWNPSFEIQILEKTDFSKPDLEAWKLGSEILKFWNLGFENWVWEPSFENSVLSSGFWKPGWILGFWSLGLENPSFYVWALKNGFGNVEFGIRIWGGGGGMDFEIWVWKSFGLWNVEVKKSGLGNHLGFETLRFRNFGFEIIWVMKRWGLEILVLK